VTVDSPEPLELVLQALFAAQRFAILATQEGALPYVSLMAFAATSDLRQLLFTMERQTRKYANLHANPRTAVLIDSRSNQSSDTHSAIAVTALGAAEEVAGMERDDLLRLYLAKHPHLAEFTRLPSCALIRINVESYYVVSNFQEVRELHFKSYAAPGKAKR
jgi:nitroimidazol reductase NimA-like FMN-containing flavoprotein (pyridoxamine 5'-phosphate oxidase superfamily)